MYAQNVCHELMITSASLSEAQLQHVGFAMGILREKGSNSGPVSLSHRDQVSWARNSPAGV